MTSTHSIQYGDTTIEYHLSFAPRKTLAIEVHPDLRVTVRAPEGSELETIRQKVKKRVPWILRQQRQFESYLPKLPPRQYVSGETHRYLGRQYRLKVSEGDSEGVKLSRGYFFITAPDKNDTERVKTLLLDWYRQQAERVFKERLEACLTKLRFLQLDEPELEIRQMDTRWGSCTPEGKILLNLRLIQVPKEYIDYVVMHELCHLKEHNHSRRFYELLNRVMPDWRAKREQLNVLEVS
ncbi:MAG: M48 family metallopeptidase [Chloroflexi bacterium]|nr:M48 family metallopeptidase [Chloroflexota bacterium]